MPVANSAILSGVRSSQWPLWKPKLKAFVFPGGSPPTQPDLGNATVFGEYFRTGSGLVIANGFIQAGSTTTFGSGEDFLGVSLPVSVDRSSGGADIPIGDAWVSLGPSANPQTNQQLTPTPMDPAQPFGQFGNEDEWFQMFCQWCIARGTTSIVSGTTSIAVNHGLPFTPRAEDFHPIATNNPTANAGAIIVSAVSSTQVTFACRTNPGASGLNISWKCFAEPYGPTASASTGGLLLSRLAPFTLATGTILSFSLQYEGRR